MKKIFEKWYKKMEDRYLFKGKEKDSGKWLKWNAVAGVPHNVSILTDTICQCTGLKDRNGKLIWENDIMVAHLHLDNDYPEDETYIRILWRGSGFYSKEKGSEDIMRIGKIDLEYFEVISNIFDNPELIEG